jgi:uncharacterized protein YndB with AHSA1/START domain
MVAPLDIQLGSDREITMTRVFAAPAHLVFEAWTNPAQLQRWYGCEDAKLVVCEVDLRVGGTFRFVTRLPDGQELAMAGTYLEVVPPERLVCTQRLESKPGEAVVTTTFVERAGKTTFTSTAIYATRAIRDAVLAAGVVKGSEVALDRLAAMLRVAA